MLFNKTALCSVVQFVGPEFFLCNTEDNCNTRKQTFAVNDFVILGFLELLHEISPLRGVDNSKPV